MQMPAWHHHALPEAYADHPFPRCTSGLTGNTPNWFSRVDEIRFLTDDGTYRPGDDIDISITFIRPDGTAVNLIHLTSGGGRQDIYGPLNHTFLELNMPNRNADFFNKSAPDTLVYRYTVQSGDSSDDLGYAHINGLHAPALQSGNTAICELPAPGGPGSLRHRSNIVVDGVMPRVDNVTSSNGAYAAGRQFNVTVNFDETVLVSDMSPSLSLALDGANATAPYLAGSNTSSLVFNYTVRPGDAASRLDYAGKMALAASDGVITDAVGNAANLTLPEPGGNGSLGRSTDIRIDTDAPSVDSVSSTSANAAYGIGSGINITVTFDEAVNVTGTPVLALDAGAAGRNAEYESGSGMRILTFNYTVQPGDGTSDLDYTNSSALTLNGGTIRDAARNAASLTLPEPGGNGSLGRSTDIRIDTDAPSVDSVSSTSANAAYGIGSGINITVTFDEAVNVTGTPVLALDAGAAGRNAEYESGSGMRILTFNYTVQPGDGTSDLDYTNSSALTLNGGTIRDAARNAASLTLPEPGEDGSLGRSKAIVINTTVPPTTPPPPVVVTPGNDNGTGTGDGTPAQPAGSTVAIGALMTEPGQEFDDADRIRVLRYAVDRFNEQSAGFDLALSVTSITRGSEPARLVEAYDGGAGPLYYVGPTTSQGLTNIREDAASMDVLARTVLLSPSSEAPQLAIPGDRIFRLALNVERQGDILVGEMESAGIDSLVVVARDDAWGRQLADYVRTAAAERGISDAGQILFSDSADPAYWQGIAGQAEGSATAAGGDVGVFFAGYGTSYPSMAASASGSTVLAGTSWFAPSTAIVASSPLQAGPVRDFSAAVGLTVLEENVPENDLTRAINSNLSSPVPLSFYEYSTYDSVFVLGGAIAAAGGPSASAASVAAALPAAALNYTGALGDIILDKNGDLRSPDRFTVWKADRGTGELAEAGSTSTPLTRIGALMALGYQDWPDDLTLDGLRLAVADYNEGEKGSLVKLIAYNITNRDALDVLREAHAGGDGPSIYVGPSLSSNLARIADYANDNGIVLFSTGSEAESLSVPGDNIFRMALSTDRQAAHMGRAMADRGAESVVMLVRDDEWGLSLNGTLAETLASRGVDVAATMRFAPGGAADWERVVGEAAAAVSAAGGGADAATMVAFVGVINDLDGLADAAAMDAASRATLTGVEWFVTTSTVSSVGFPMIQDQTTRDFASDARNLTAIDNSVDRRGELPDGLSAADRMCGTYADAVNGDYLRAYFECNVPNTWFYEFAAYDALFVLGEAVRSGIADGLEVNATSLGTAIPVAAEAHTGILGDIELNANGDLLTPDRFGIWYVRDGNWTDTGALLVTPVVNIGVLAALGDADYPDDLTVEALRRAAYDHNNADESRPVFVNLAVHNITGRDVLDVLREAHGGSDDRSIYVGPTLSSNLARLADYAGANDLLLFSPESEAQSLAVSGDGIFRMSISTGRQGAVIGGVMADAGIGSAVVVVRDDEWGRDLNASIVETLSARGVRAAASLPFAPGGAFNWTAGVADISAAISDAASASPAAVGVAFIGVVGDQNALAEAWAAAGEDRTTLAAAQWFVTPSGISASPRIPDDAARSFAASTNMTGIMIDVGDNPMRAALDADLPGLTFYQYAAYDTLRVVGEALAANAASGRSTAAAGAAQSIQAAAIAYNGALGDVALDSKGDLLVPNVFSVWRVAADGTWEDTDARKAAPVLGSEPPRFDCGDEGISCITLGDMYLANATGQGRAYINGFHGAYAIAADDYNREQEAKGSPLRVVLERVDVPLVPPAGALDGAYAGGDGIVAYLGPIPGLTAARLAPFMDETGIVMVSPAAPGSSPPLVRPDGLFRLSLNDRYEADLIAIVADREGVETVVPVLIDNPYGRSYGAELEIEARLLGIEYLDPVYMAPLTGDKAPAAAELNARIAALDSAGADLSKVGVILASLNLELHAFAHHALDYPLLSSVKWFDPGHLFPPDTIEDPEALRLARTAPFYSMSWEPAADAPRLERFRDTFVAANGFEPHQYSYSSYDSVYMLADAIKMSMDGDDGSYTGRGAAARMHEAAEGLDGMLGGNVRLDANGDRVSPSRVIIWKAAPGTGDWVDTGDREMHEPICGISLASRTLAFGSVAAGSQSGVATQTVRNAGTMPLGSLAVAATGWTNAAGGEVLPAGATSVMVGADGAWTPLGASVGAELRGDAPAVEAKFRLDVPRDGAAAGQVSQSVTYTVSCTMP